MNKDIKVYIPLDSLFDYRQGLICKIITDPTQDNATRLVDAANKWVQYLAKRYDERRMDLFECPEIGLTHAKFEEAYANRSIDDFAFYTPSNLSKLIMAQIMEAESEYEQLPNIRSFSFVVNTWPYVLTDELQEILHESLTKRFRGKHDISFMHVDDTKATPSFYRSFSYVFKYDILLRDYKPFMDNLVNEPLPEVVFFVPDLFIKFQEYITGKPADVIEAFALTVVNQLALKPIPHAAYDHQ
jgi:hypothetical protein